MQWLVDLVAERVINTIGIPPTFIDRGDPVNYDFWKDDFIFDSNFHELDLSAIVPENAKAVLLSVLATHLQASTLFIFREHGNANAINVSQGVTQVADMEYRCDFVTPIGPDRKIDYYTTAGVWEAFFVSVKGWWL